jgi:hypothetical protein
MAPSDPSSDERVNTFQVDERHLFKHYFEGEDVFARLKPYYNAQQYRFEIPPDEFDDVRSFLTEHGYELVVVGPTEKFVVVVEQYTTHPEGVFEESVAQRSVDGYNCFLVTDQYAVAGAVAEGATRLSDTDLPNPFQ